MQFHFKRISEAKDYILTALILLLSIVLLIGRSRGGIDTLRKASITLFSYLEEPLSSIQMYRRALKTNTKLRKQNILLQDRLNRIQAVAERNDELQAMLQFSRNSDLSLYPVQIVAKNLTGVNNVLTIDAGSAEGIKKGMAVISAQGLIGTVVLTAKHYSQVMPFLHPLFRISATLSQSNAYGIVKWGGEHINRLVLKYIPQTVPVDSGEVVLTSGYSTLYPANIPIGEVIYTKPEKGKETKNVYIDPFINLFRIAEGFVVTAEPDTVIKKLNKRYNKMFK